MTGRVCSASHSLPTQSLNTKLEETLSDHIKRQDPIICSLQEINFKQNDISRLKVKGQKKIYHANTNQNEF